MMSIRTKLRKAKNAASLVTLLSVSATALGSQGCVQKLGQELKMKEGISETTSEVRHRDDEGNYDSLEYESEGIQLDADGKMSDDERMALKRMTYNWETVDQTNKRMRMLVSDLNKFASQKMKTRGLKWRGLGDLSLNTTNDRTEMEEAFDNCTRGQEDLPDAFSAFYCDLNREITQPESGAVSFFPLLFHEWGHDQNIYDAADNISEFPAEANRIWMTYNLIGMDQEVGTMLSNTLVHSRIPGETDVVSIKGMGKYNAASLAFYMAANNFGGDLDKAADFMFTKGKKSLQEMFKDAVKKHPNMNARQIWQRELSQLFDSEGFQTYLNGLVTRNNSGSRTEAEELKDYFKLKFQNSLIVLAEGSGKDATAEKSLKSLMLKQYADKGFKHGFHNAKFMNQVVEGVTPVLLADANDAYTASKIDNPKAIDAAIKSLEKVVKLNEKFPCEFEEFSCTLSFTETKGDHFSSYQKLADAYWQKGKLTEKIADKEKAVETLYDFLDKFYPINAGEVTDYSYETNGKMQTKQLLKSAYIGFLYSDSLSKSFKSAGNLEKANEYACNAKDFAEIYNAATCENIEDETMKQECYNETYSSLTLEKFMQESEDSSVCAE
jgi:tetratricopeptide (TPR) repeat protein